MRPAILTRARVARVRRGLTIEELSKRSGVSRNYIMNIERGFMRPMDEEMALALARELGLDPEDLTRPAQ